MEVWKRTKKWNPACHGGGSAGFSVECMEGGRLGHAKPQSMWQEVLAFRLAREIGINVPEVAFGECDGQTVAVSNLWGGISMDIPTMQNVDAVAFASEEMQMTLRNDSGRVVFHTWIRNGDFKNQHVMVKPGPTKNSYETACIDFAAAFSWPDSDDGLAPIGGPPILLQSKNASSVRAVLSAIEQLTDERIRQIVEGIPEDQVSADKKRHITNGLIVRKQNLRQTFQTAGWLG